jgi:predicted DsbA family dithiol-disulfide isomerase
LFKKKGMPINIDKAMAHLQATAEQYGLKMGKRTRTYNSRLAQEVGLWAQTSGHGHAFHMAAFEAYFVEGENISSKKVLLKLIKQSGLDPAEGEAIMDNREFSDAVDADWELSRSVGITAVPTFRMGLDTLVGAKPYAQLKQMVEKYTSN